jgi:uncharacterized alpha-E superfamily protein
MAQNLFWMSRYIERAENMARLLDVGYRMSLTSGREGSASEHLVSMLQAAEVDEAYAETGRPADIASVSHFMLFDETNSSSVWSCLKWARTNARSVRTALTTDVWETINDGWLQFAAIDPSEISGARLPELLSWVRQMSNQFRGAHIGTILRDDGFAFARAGTFVERADNTARILDMKYFVLLPRVDLIGGDIDVSQWTLILRAASAHKSYRHVYHDRYRAKNVADFLMLRPEMPRSLIYCAQQLDQQLDTLDDHYGARMPCHDEADDLLAMLDGNDMDRIFQHGLHEFLTEFIARNNHVTESLSASYNFY